MRSARTYDKASYMDSADLALLRRFAVQECTGHSWAASRGSLLRDGCEQGKLFSPDSAKLVAVMLQQALPLLNELTRLNAENLKLSRMVRDLIARDPVLTPKRTKSTKTS